MFLIRESVKSAILCVRVYMIRKLNKKEKSGPDVEHVNLVFNSFMFEIPLKTTDVGGISCSYFILR